MSSTEYRLPRHVIPVDYDVDIDASPKRQSFGGTLLLTAKVQQAADSFELNARELKVSDVRAKAASKSIPGRAELDPSREVVELHFDKPLPKGKVVVQMSFKGKLNPSMHGLYLAKDGPERAIVSQCEATDARAIFPCFDEPDLKATLRWTVRTDPGLAVICNGVPDKVTKTRKPPREVHHFKRTKVVSTYLTALTIGKLDVTKAQRVSRIPCRVACGVGKLDQTRFAEEVTAYVLPWYENYFGHKYNFQKLDQVAVPGFDAGAMENIGAIFYRQNLLLMQPGATSWNAKKRIGEVIAHEIAHQWFGNLVTMKWWDDLWLNEAFATFMSYTVCHSWHPEWRIWDDYLDSKLAALSADALRNTHPIYSDVKSPAEATELFDVITYEKGCAVLRMANSYLGADTFRKGIQSYIDAHKNSNAAGADLWNSLAAASDEPVDALMQSWITQSGHPLVTVSLGEQSGRTVLHVSQRRFFANPEAMQESTDQLWMIPMVIAYDGGNGVATHRFLLRDAEATIELPTEGRVRWVYPNVDSTGFYRLHLDDDCLQGLLQHGLTGLSPASRAGLLSDQWALVKNGLSDVETFMDVLAAFRDERDHVVVRTISGMLGYLDERLVSDADRPLLAQFVRWLLEPQLEELGWEPVADEGPAQAVRRAIVIDTLGEVGEDDAVLGRAEEQVEVEIEDPTAVEPNLAGAVVQLAAHRGGVKRLERFVKVYLDRKRHGSAPELQARYLAALSGFRQSAVIPEVLELCLDGTIPQEQLRTVLVPLLAHRASGRQAWQFLKKNWSTIRPRVGSMGVSRLVESTGAIDVSLRDDVARFFAKNPVDEAKRALQKALEAMDLRKELIEREAPRLSDWLRRAPSNPRAVAGSY